MKGTKKFIAILTLAAALLCFSAIGAGAASDTALTPTEGALASATEGAEYADAVKNADASTAGDAAQNGENGAELGAEGGETDGGESDVGTNPDEDDSAAQDGENEAESGADTGEKINPFAALYASVRDNSAEIASIAAAVCSAILAIVMSRGLTPMLKDALGGITRATHKLGEGVCETEKRSAQITEALTERLALAESTVERLADAVNALTEAKAHEGEEQLMREDILTVMSAQVELLYDVFMSSSLPQYKKDAVGERVSLMRHKLTAEGAKADEA